MSRVTRLLKQEFLLDGRYSHIQEFADHPRHRWYAFKEAFTPYIVEQAIENAGCGTSDIIIDPFCGSGTTPLVASLKGFQTIGFEVNPFLAFLGRTKLLQCGKTEIDRGFQVVTQGVKMGKISLLETYSTFSKAGGKEKWLFNEQILRAFEGGWGVASTLENPVRDLLCLALLNAAMDNCNAYRDGKCLRYKKGWDTLNLRSEEFLASFEAHINVIMADLETTPIRENKSTIHDGDSRSLMGNHVSDKFKLCVTSPPYLNSFDYSDVYRPELFLSKYVASSKELMEIRLRTMRSHVQVNWEKPNKKSFGPLYKDSIKKVLERADDLWDDRIPFMIQAYFEDMERILCSLYTLAKPDATLWLVVSTSAYVGVQIPVDLIIADIGERVGWHLREVHVLKYLRTSGQHWKKWAKEGEHKPRLRESVVIFDASPRRR